MLGLTFTLKDYTSKSLWSDEDLHTLISFQPSKFLIRPQYNLTPDQLLACCLVGIHTANTLRVLHGHTQLWDDVITLSTHKFCLVIAQNDLLLMLQSR